MVYYDERALLLWKLFHVLLLYDPYKLKEYICKVKNVVQIKNGKCFKFVSDKVTFKKSVVLVNDD